MKEENSKEETKGGGEEQKVKKKVRHFDRYFFPLFSSFLFFFFLTFYFFSFLHTSHVPVWSQRTISVQLLPLLRQRAPTAGGGPHPREELEDLVYNDDWEGDDEDSLPLTPGQRSDREHLLWKQRRAP